MVPTDAKFQVTLFQIQVESKNLTTILHLWHFLVVNTIDAHSVHEKQDKTSLRIPVFQLCLSSSSLLVWGFEAAQALEVLSWGVRLHVRTRVAHDLSSV